MSITIMKQALKYLEKSHYLIADHERHAYVMEYNAFLEQFQQAIAQEALNRMAENARELGLDYETEQEPVAMRYDFDGYGWKYVDSGFGSNWQEWIRKLYKDAEPIYTSPPQPQEATRKPLTDEEIDVIRLEMGYAAGMERFTKIARAIEAAHGIGEKI